MNPGKLMLGLALSWLMLPGLAWSQEAIPLYNTSVGGPERPVRGSRVSGPPAGMLMSEVQPGAEMPEGMVGAEQAPLQELEDPELGGHYTFYTSLEYLLWKARRRDLDYAIIDPLNDGRAQGDIARAQYPERSGFRLGLGVHLPEEWVLVGYYTYFHSATGAFAVAPAGGVLYANRTHPGLVEQVALAGSQVSINYNVWDLELTKKFPVGGETFVVRPFGGLRFANISQNNTTGYSGGDATNDVVFNDLDLTAAGPRIGAECTWNMCWGLGLFARAGGSLMYADYDYNTNEQNAGLVVSQVKGQNQQILPVLEMALGASYTYRNLRLSVGYEVTNWFGLNDGADFADDIHQGKIIYRASDLSLSGVTFRSELSF